MEWKHNKKNNTYWISYSKNNMSCVLAFWCDRYDGRKHFWTMFGVGKNRKQVLSWINNKTTFINRKITGNCDPSYLIFCRHAFHDFENYIKTKFPTEDIIIQVGASDKKRFDLYQKYLSKFGYLKFPACNKENYDYMLEKIL